MEMGNFKVLTMILLVAAFFAAAPNASAAPTFTCTFTPGNSAVVGDTATVAYSVTGGVAVTYDVVMTNIVGCATILPPLTQATIPDLVGPAQTQSFKLVCSSPSSSGYVVLEFREGVNLLSTWVVSYTSNASCANLVQNEVKEIPTLSEWAMIVFSVLLLGLMTWYVVKRRRTAHSVAV
jgi:hypothetical protein